jgi:hypothetical protein
MELGGRIARAGLLLFLVLFMASAKEPEATIIDTGSTNRAGMRVTFDREGHASIEQRNEEIRRVKLNERLCKRFMEDMRAAAPLSALPSGHCMKSVSFGSSMFVEFEGDRSPDLSCPRQTDERAAALQKDANEILQAARALVPEHRPKFE